MHLEAFHSAILSAAKLTKMCILAEIKINMNLMGIHIKSLHVLVYRCFDQPQFFTVIKTEHSIISEGTHKFCFMNYDFSFV